MKTEKQQEIVGTAADSAKRAFRAWRAGGLQTVRGVRPCRPPQAGAYMLTEALVYIGAIVVLLGVATAVMYRCIDSSLALRRNADDITRTMHVGELWRADVRAATAVTRLEEAEAGPTLRLESRRGTVAYLFARGAVYRRAGSGTWSRILDKVKSSEMHPEKRSGILTWHWDIELQPQTKGTVRAGRVRPLFSFIAVPSTSTNL